jgi:3-isopropylmalate dehydrogenase
MAYRIVALPGDGIGPEVTAEAIAVLERAASCFGFEVQVSQGLVGGEAIDRLGVPLPQEVLAEAKRSDAVLLGAVGGPKWDDPRARVRPEQALLGLRKELGLFANLRPVKVFGCLKGACPLKEHVTSGVDLVVVRELTGGLYFGRPSERREVGGVRSAVDTLQYGEEEIRRLLERAFELAAARKGKVTSVDKANILATSRLWREVAHEVASRYPQVACEDMLVDAAAMRLLRAPADFDVIATENMFGDILTDEASMLAGSLGLLPSASLGEKKTRDGKGLLGMYEPVHGSAPDIAGRGVANPLGAILSVAMMLRHSLSQPQAAASVERAAREVLESGYRTPDIMAPGLKEVGCSQMGRLVAERLG